MSLADVEWSSGCSGFACHLVDLVEYANNAKELNIYFSKRFTKSLLGKIQNLNVNEGQAVIRSRITPQLQSTFLCFIQRMWLKLECISKPVHTQNTYLKKQGSIKLPQQQALAALRTRVSVCVRVILMTV